jgi:hypothetical protein
MLLLTDGTSLAISRLIEGHVPVDKPKFACCGSRPVTASKVPIERDVLITVTLTLIYSCTAPEKILSQWKNDDDGKR